MKLALKRQVTQKTRTPIRTYLKLVSQRAMMPEYSGSYDRDRNKSYYR